MSTRTNKLTEMVSMATLTAQRVVVGHARFLADNPRYAHLIEALETRHRCGPFFGGLWDGIRNAFRHLGNHPFSVSYQLRTDCTNDEEHALSRLCHAADADDINLHLLLAMKRIGDHPKRGQDFIAMIDNLDTIRAEIAAERQQSSRRLHRRNGCNDG